ncbi:MAG: AMP-binding protein, partial [Zoogloea sp.]|nr:AMP-binding protein [Zoogloea sp.]
RVLFRSLPTGLARTALARGIDLFTGYGMSETCPILSIAHVDPDIADDDLDRQLEARAKTGRALPLVDLRIVGDTWRDVPRDGRTPGELVVRAPWLTGGYLHDPLASEGLWQGGYLHTGDIGNIDATGRVKITDRCKDVIKVGGEWISSLEIENVISHHPAVAEVAVVAIPDGKWGERPLAAVVLRPEHAGKLGEDEIQHHVKRCVDSGAIPRLAILTRVRFTDSLSKTSVGKLNKMHMREEFGAGAQATTTAPA